VTGSWCSQVHRTGHSAVEGEQGASDVVECLIHGVIYVAVLALGGEAAKAYHQHLADSATDLEEQSCSWSVASAERRALRAAGHLTECHVVRLCLRGSQLFYCGDIVRSRCSEAVLLVIVVCPLSGCDWDYSCARYADDGFRGPSRRSVAQVVVKALSVGRADGPVWATCRDYALHLFLVRFAMVILARIAPSAAGSDRNSEA
jgi:hypothetical protein